ncbi:hypothetical protein CRENBAI_002471 [Crenichthys baileyi]|uniref:Uncharacterized protein n=1 Tax=Crenichthys baileyi TaxID=28760 RepID=A0AAV9SS78_9TELE
MGLFNRSAECRKQPDSLSKVSCCLTTNGEGQHTPNKAEQTGCMGENVNRLILSFNVGVYTVFIVQRRGSLSTAWSDIHLSMSTLGNLESEGMVFSSSVTSLRAWKKVPAN